MLILEKNIIKKIISVMFSMNIHNCFLLMADFAFELQCGVINFELLVQSFLNALCNLASIADELVFYDEVCAECPELRR